MVLWVLWIDFICGPVPGHIFRRSGLVDRQDPDECRVVSDEGPEAGEFDDALDVVDDFDLSWASWESKVKSMLRA